MIIYGFSPDSRLVTVFAYDHIAHDHICAHNGILAYPYMRLIIMRIVMFIYAHGHAHKCSCAHMFLYAHGNICTYIFMHIYAHEHVHISHMRIIISIYAHQNICAQLCSYIRITIYTHSYVRMCA